jgi:hypothetical protein
MSAGQAAAPGTGRAGVHQPAARIIIEVFKAPDGDALIWLSASVPQGWTLQ